MAGTEYAKGDRLRAGTEYVKGDRLRLRFRRAPGFLPSPGCEKLCCRAEWTETVEVLRAFRSGRLNVTNGSYGYAVKLGNPLVEVVARVGAAEPLSCLA